MNIILNKIDKNLDLNIEYIDVPDYINNMDLYNQAQAESIKDIKQTGLLKSTHDVRDEIFESELTKTKVDSKEAHNQSQIMKKHTHAAKLANKVHIVKQMYGEKIVENIVEENVLENFNKAKEKAAAMMAEKKSSEQRAEEKDKIMEE